VSLEWGLLSQIDERETVESELEKEIEALGENSLPCQFRPPQIPHYVTWDVARDSAAGIGRLTSGTMP
jgi:hypothetical protein